MSPHSLLVSHAHARRQAGRLQEAVKLYRDALAQQPGDIDTLFHLALSLRALNRPVESLSAIERACALAPQEAELHHLRGNLLKALGRIREATASLGTAARLAPKSAPIWLNLGVAQMEAGQKKDAVESFTRAIDLEPERAEAHNILGVALRAAGRLTEARHALETALRLNPDYAAAHDNLGGVCKISGLLAEAVLHYRAALAANANPGTHSNLLFALNYLPDLPPREVFAEHRRWHDRHAAPLLPPPATPSTLPPPPSGRRLRLGYLSPDFNHHAVAYFIEPVLAAHDRDRIELFCYANVRDPDRVTTRLRALAEHWRDISRLDDEAAAAAIRTDKLDILIDLAGHTAHHRLLVLARRPAPVQATWIGYPNTTGLDAVDYRLTDAISDPPGMTEHLHSEKLVRLPTSFSCYRPDPEAPAVAPPPATTPGQVVFASFNNFAKITSRVIELWASILRALPSSRLLLKSRGLEDPAIGTHIRDVFQSAGINGDRLMLNGSELPVRAHLDLYRQVDIGLDPFPYNGTTTTCEALWMGVPVLTLPGQVHAARVGASLLTHAGLTEWIATSLDDYVAKAVTAANDLPRLASLRHALRERLRMSPLCDATRFTRDFEETCLAMATRRI